MERFVYELTPKDNNGGESVYICIYYQDGNPVQEITLNSQENSATFTLNIDDLNSAKFFDLAQKLLEFEIKYKNAPKQGVLGIQGELGPGPGPRGVIVDSLSTVTPPY